LAQDLAQDLAQFKNNARRLQGIPARGMSWNGDQQSKNNLELAPGKGPTPPGY